MAVTLAVEVDQWRAHLRRYVAEHPDLIPVIKGNGYGFGRQRLVDECRRLGLDAYAVGTAWELEPTETAVVLTPCATLADAQALTPNATATVGSTRHIAVLRDAGWRGAVLVKLRTSLGRYGAERDQLAELMRAVDAAGLELAGFGLHFPLAGTAADHAAELTAWLAHLPPGATVHVGHVLPPPTTMHRLRPRVGTALWLGARDALHLEADVVDVRPTTRGDRVGYRQVETPTSGHLVLVGGGTAHGITALDDGRSPFHFARTRLSLLEPPHMHTSMCFVPDGTPCPEPGDRVDVQRPLTRTLVDCVEDR